MSVNVGQTIRFKIKTPAASHHIDTSPRVRPKQRSEEDRLRASATLPQSQPACLTDSSTGLIDCGNWGSRLPGPCRVPRCPDCISHILSVTTQAAIVRFRSSGRRRRSWQRIERNSCTSLWSSISRRASSASTAARCPSGATGPQPVSGHRREREGLGAGSTNPCVSHEVGPRCETVRSLVKASRSESISSVS